MTPAIAIAPTFGLDGLGPGEDPPDPPFCNRRTSNTLRSPAGFLVQCMGHHWVGIVPPSLFCLGFCLIYTGHEVHRQAAVVVVVVVVVVVIGGLKVSEQLRMWQDRIKILSNPPWILSPILRSVTDSRTIWADIMTARPIVVTDGLLTIALGHGADYDQTYRSCGLFNRVIIDKNGRVVRKLRIDHDTKAKQRYLRPDKRQSVASEPVSANRQKDDSSWSRRQWSNQAWWDQNDTRGATSSSSWSWSWH